MRGGRLGAEPVRDGELPKRPCAAGSRCADPPPEQLLVETDAPFLTPHPYRGAPNEPYCLPYTVRALADVVGRPAETIAEESSATAERVYGLQSC